jgi:ribonuclease G
MKNDKAKHKILPPSKFGIVQITRQRVRPQKQLNTTEENPNINGKVESPIVLVDKIQQQILNATVNNKGKLYLHTHPFVAAYLTKGIKSIRNEWILNYKRWIRVIPRDSFKYLEFQIQNENKDVIYKFSN